MFSFLSVADRLTIRYESMVSNSGYQKPLNLSNLRLVLRITLLASGLYKKNSSKLSCTNTNGLCNISSRSRPERQPVVRKSTLKLYLSVLVKVRLILLLTWSYMCYTIIQSPTFYCETTIHQPHLNLLFYFCPSRFISGVDSSIFRNNCLHTIRFVITV